MVDAIDPEKLQNLTVAVYEARVGGIAHAVPAGGSRAMRGWVGRFLAYAVY